MSDSQEDMRPDQDHVAKAPRVFSVVGENGPEMVSRDELERLGIERPDIVITEGPDAGSLSMRPTERTRVNLARERRVIE